MPGATFSRQQSIGDSVITFPDTVNSRTDFDTLSRLLEATGLDKADKQCLSDLRYLVPASDWSVSVAHCQGVCHQGRGLLDSGHQAGQLHRRPAGAQVPQPGHPGQAGQAPGRRGAEGGLLELPADGQEGPAPDEVSSRF